MKSIDLAIDCRLRQKTGIGRYIKEVVPRVARLLPDCRYLLIGPEYNDSWLRENFGGEVEILPCSAKVFRWEEQGILRTAGQRARVLWCPHFCIPLRLPASAVLLTTVHDLIPLHVAQGWKGHVRRLGARVYLRAVKSQSARILTPSVAVANQLEKELGFNVEKLRPIPLGVDEGWYNAGRQPCPAGIGGRPYVLYVGNISAHKNVDGLLRAFSTILSKVPHRLVVLGEKRGFTAHASLAALVQLLGDRVVFLSRLSEAELHGLVAGADLLVQPSLEEGFGLPPLEAMAAGCPVLSSDAVALVETTGPGAHHFKLSVPGDLAHQLERLLVDTSLRLQLINAGREWARRFTWDKTAEQTAQVIRELLS